LRTFTPHEARTVEALTARILPGTPEDPGAREAGVTTYIDNMLAYQEGFTETTYREPPYAQIYSGDSPPEDEGTYETVWVAADHIERYGYQSILSPREVYRLGVIAVDAYSRSKFGMPYIELEEAQQDSVIEDMVNGDATAGFESISATSFFAVLRRHTAEGMFSDPAYETTPRPPQSLAQLHPFSPGEYSGPYTVLPVSGSQEEYPVHHDHP
jgi:gluconate 2-dehydrogenase gamma chain